MDMINSLKYDFIVSVVEILPTEAKMERSNAPISITPILELQPILS